MKGIILFEPMERHVELTWSEDVEQYIKERRMPAICVIPEAKFEDVAKLRDHFIEVYAAENTLHAASAKGTWRYAPYLPWSVALEYFVKDVNRNIIEWASFVAHLLNLNAQRTQPV